MLTSTLRVLLCSTAWKGSLSANLIHPKLQEALETLWPQAQVDAHPMADGGDGWLDALKEGSQAPLETHTVLVMGPLPSITLKAPYLWDPSTHTAYLESAQIHGLKRLSSGPKAPMLATSTGVGEALIELKTQHPHIQHLVVSVGGSASTDGGCGCLQALGWTFYNLYGQAIPRGLGGEGLIQTQQIEAPKVSPLHTLQTTLLVDVETTYINAPRVFGPQKGASPTQVATLTHGLMHIQERLGHPNALNHPGSGAAGGLGGALMLACDTLSVESGFNWTATFTGLRDALDGKDLVITGEGQVDETSLYGKGTGALMAWAESTQTPLLVLCGTCTLKAPPNPWVRIVPLYPAGEALTPEDYELTLPRLSQSLLVALSGMPPKPQGPVDDSWAVVCEPMGWQAPRHPLTEPGTPQSV